MPNFCLVVGCSSNSAKDKLSFFRVPAVFDNNKRYDELRAKRRKAWVQALKRMDLTESKLNNDRICSKHFIFKREYENHSLETLRGIGAKLNLSITIEECKQIELLTKKQAKSKEWFQFRSGRITASKFKAVCRTSLEKPSISLIKSICYPIHMSFQSRATTYGCLHEKIALKDYAHAMQKSHLNFGSDMVGLCLNPKFPQFGASPDALVSCDCCGLGCCEIKCPFCAKDLDVEDLAVLKRVGLTRNKQLDVTHQYYYQIQMQLGLTRLKYCDFVVWNKNGFVKERIFLNENFWEENYKVATKFFEYVILPELLGKYYSRNA